MPLQLTFLIFGFLLDSLLLKFVPYFNADGRLEVFVGVQANARTRANARTKANVLERRIKFNLS